MQIALVGNKIDLEENRQVSTSEGETKAKQVPGSHMMIYDLFVFSSI